MSKKSKPVNKSKNMNPALQRAIMASKIEASLKDAHKKGIIKGCLGYEIISLMTIYDKLGIEDVDTLKMYCEEVDSLAESVLKEDVSMQDIIDTLRDEKGFTITNETLVSIDPGLAQYLKPSDEK